MTDNPELVLLQFSLDQLSVVLFDHKLTAGQWLGAGVVFLGIGVEVRLPSVFLSFKPAIVLSDARVILSRSIQRLNPGLGKDLGSVLSSFAFHAAFPCVPVAPD